LAKDYIALAEQYEADVIAGTVPACSWVRLACERNARDRAREDWPFVFDTAAAERICKFAELLPHIKGPKAKVIGRDAEGRSLWATIALEPWQCWILTTMFGWLHRESGLRRFRVALILIPRKNAKSTLGAIIALYMLVADGEGGAECYSAATTRDQAKAVAEIAWEMAKRSPQFCEFYGVRIGSETTRSLSIPRGGAGNPNSSSSKFAPLSADANTLDGLNVSCAIVDELHAHKNERVWGVLDTGTGARPQPWLIGITTAGVDLGGICHQKMGYMEKVLQQIAEDDTFFGINYTIDPDDLDHIGDELVQRKANPNYGVSVMPDDLQRKVKEAHVTAASLNNVLTKHFNVWIRSESTWMPIEAWRACIVPGLTIEDCKEHLCWIGVDLAEVRDFAAVVVLFKLDADRYAMFPRLYLPEDTIDRLPVAEISGWVRDGYVIETPGNQADFKRIQQDIRTLCETYQVQEIDFDGHLAAHMQQDLKDWLEPRMGRDAAELFVVTVSQAKATIHPAMQMLERLVLAKGLQHDGNPAFTWMVSNVVVEGSGDARSPKKAGGRDSHNKIDGPMALLDALSRAMSHTAAPTGMIAAWV
jgi:phage terminase large subunit-like protein